MDKSYKLDLMKGIKMKFTCEQGNFLKALNQVSRIVSSRTTLPILSNILISVTKDKIFLSSTDLEVAVTAQAEGKIEQEGKLTIPARLLSDFITNNHDKTINFSTPKENILNLKSEHFEAKITGISAEEYPTIPEMPKENVLNIESKELLEATKKTVIATANDETRPVLAGIYFQFDGNVLTMAATDSFRLAEKKIALKEEINDKKFIVPMRTMTEVLRLMSSIEGDSVTISFTENQIAFKIGNTEVVSRLIEGAFPNYAQIIPANFKISIVADFVTLNDAVKMSALFSKNSANNIKLNIKDGALTIISEAAETGEATSKIPAEVTGGDITVAFNARYILDVLQILSSEKITINLNDESSAGMITTKDDKDYLYIAMPLRLDQ